MSLASGHTANNIHKEKLTLELTFTFTDPYILIQQVDLILADTSIWD